MGDMFKDFAELTSNALQNTFGKLNKLYLVFIFVLLRYFVDSISLFSFLGRGFIVGLLNYFVEILVLSFVCQSLRSLVVYGNSGKKSIGNSINNFMNPLISTMFYLYLLDLFISMISIGANIRGVLVVTSIFKVLTSAVIEEVYINNKYGFDAVKSSFKFVVDNLLNYGLFSLIFIIIEIFITYKLTFSLGFGMDKFLNMLILALVHTLVLTFKGHLFKYIDENPYRQRKLKRG